VPTWAIQYRRAGPSDRTFLGRGDPDRLRGEPALAGLWAPVPDLTGSIIRATGQGGGPGIAGSNGSGAATFSASILDLIAKFEPHSAFHLWAGRMLVASDRSNFSGPWFMSPWKYPGLYPTLPYPVGPKQGPQGRNNGATVWGEFLGAKLKYYAGVFDLNDTTVSPLITGRVNICAIGSESGFYHSSTYYGSQDILAFGLGYQYQKNGSTNPLTMAVGNLNTVIADALFEKNLGAGGVIDVEGQYYHFDENDAFGRKHAYFGLVSWLTPQKLGVGKLQPLVRLQQATAQTPAGAPSTPPTWTMFDAYVTYVVDDYFLRVAAGYSHADMGTTPTSNAVYLGVQMQR